MILLIKNIKDFHVEIGKYEIDESEIAQINKYESYLEKYFQDFFKYNLFQHLKMKKKALF